MVIEWMEGYGDGDAGIFGDAGDCGKRHVRIGTVVVVERFDLSCVFISGFFEFIDFHPGPGQLHVSVSDGGCVSGELYIDLVFFLFGQDNHLGLTYVLIPSNLL